VTMRSGRKIKEVRNERLERDRPSAEED